MKKNIRIGVLVSGSGSNLQAIMDACRDGKINGEVVVVGSDNPEAYGLVRAEKAGILNFAVDYKKIALALPMKKRVVFENRILSQLEACKIDLLVLAGFMKLFSASFIEEFNSKRDRLSIMNIHPAILPAFPGTKGYEDTFNYGSKVGGCTVHFIDEGEDTGPIIGQKTYIIKPDDTIDSIKEKGLKLEWELFPECIQLFAENRLQVFKNESGRTVVKIV